MMPHFTNTDNPIDFPKSDAKDMNERIRELAEEAGIVFWEMSGDVDWRQANKETLEGFAELIIKECAAYVKNSNCFTYASQADLCADRMKAHFGVE